MFQTLSSFITLLCVNNPNLYDCRIVKPGQNWWSFTPEIHLIQSVNRRNTRLQVGQVVAVPIAGNDLRTYSPFEKRSNHKNTLIIDLNVFAWAYYNDAGGLDTWGAATGGSKICTDTHLKKCTTPIGTWKMLRKGGIITRSKLYPLECEDKIKCGAKMYHYIQFSPDGAGIHGSDHGLSGQNISHGCVRVFKFDAKLLNNSLINEKSTIIVKEY
jgi:hypothetical protein